MHAGIAGCSSEALKPPHVKGLFGKFALSARTAANLAPHIFCLADRDGLHMLVAVQYVKGCVLGMALLGMKTVIPFRGQKEVKGCAGANKHEYAGRVVRL